MSENEVLDENILEDEVVGEVVDKVSDDVVEDVVEDVKDDVIVDDVIDDVVDTEDEKSRKGIIGALSEKRREVREATAVSHRLEIENAELRGKLSVSNKESVEEISPIERLLIDDPEALVDAKTLADERKWQDAKLAKQNEASVNKSFETAKQASLNQAVVKYNAKTVGEGLDFETVIETGKAFLTAGQVVDIQESLKPESAGKYEHVGLDLAYRLCIRQCPQLRELYTANRKTRTKLKKINNDNSESVLSNDGPEVSGDSVHSPLMTFLFKK